MPMKETVWRPAQPKRIRIQADGQAVNKGGATIFLCRANKIKTIARSRWFLVRVHKKKRVIESFARQNDFSCVLPKAIVVEGTSSIPKRDFFLLVVIHQLFWPFQFDAGEHASDAGEGCRRGKELRSYAVLLPLSAIPI